MTGRVILVIYTWLATDFCPFHRLCRYFGFAWETSIHAVCYVVVYYALYTVSLLYSVLYEKSYIVALVLVLCLNAWMPNALHTGPIDQSGSAYNLVGLFAAPGSKKKKKVKLGSPSSRSGSFLFSFSATLYSSVFIAIHIPIFPPIFPPLPSSILLYYPNFLLFSILLVLYWFITVLLSAILLFCYYCCIAFVV